MLANIRNYVETRDIFRWLFPEYCPDLYISTCEDKERGKWNLRRCNWGKERLDFPCSKYAGRKEGNIQCLGVEASLVSHHYDLMLYDDPVNDLNSETRQYRNKIHKWFKNSLQLRHSPQETRVRIIGTRWNYDDLYCRLEKKELKRRHRSRAMGYEVKPHLWMYRRAVVEKVPAGQGMTIVNKSNVKPIWPERFDPDTIEDLRVDNGSYIFSCQYMNNPLPEEDAIFRRSDIKELDFFDIPEQVVHFLAVDMAVDDKEESDYAAIVVASIDATGRMYVREIINEKMLPSKILELVAYLCTKWDIQRAAIETQAFQKVVWKTYQEKARENGWDIPWVEMVRGHTSKVKRFLALQPRVERGDLCYEEGIRSSMT